MSQRTAIATKIGLLSLFGLCGVVGLTLAYSQSAHFERRLISLVQPRLSRTLGERTLIAELHLQLVPPAIALSGLQIGPPSRPLITLKSATLPLVLRAGQPALGRVTLHDLYLDLPFDPSGAPLAFSKRARSDRPLARLPWDSLDLQDATVHLYSPNNELTLSELQLHPDRYGLSTLTAQTELRHERLHERVPIALEGLSLGPTRLAIPHFPFNSTFGDLEAAIDIGLDGTGEIVGSLHPYLDEINALLPEPKALYGDLDADFSLQLAPAISGQVVLRWSDIRVDMPGQTVPILSYQLGDLSAIFILDNETLLLEQSQLDWAGGTVQLTGALERDGTITHLEVLGESLSFSQILHDLGAAPHPWIDFNSDWEAQFSGQVKPFHLGGSLNLNTADLRVTDRPIAQRGAKAYLNLTHASAHATLEITPAEVLLTLDRIDGPSTHGHGTARIGTGPTGPLDLWLNFDRANLSDFGPLGGAKLAGTGSIRGRFKGPFDQLQFDGEASLNDFSLFGVPYADHIETQLYSPGLETLQLSEVVATKGTSHYNGTVSIGFQAPYELHTEVNLPDGQLFDLLNTFLPIDGVRGHAEGHLSLHGPLQHLNGRSEFTLSDVSLWGEPFSSGVARGEMRDGLFFLEQLAVERDEGQERLSLTGSVKRQWALKMRLRGKHLALEHLQAVKRSGLPLSGQADFTVTLDETLFAPSPAGTLTLSDMHYGSFPLAPSTVHLQTVSGVGLFHGKLIGGAGTLRGTLGLWKEQPFELDLYLSQFPAHLLYPVAADGREVHAFIDGALDLRGHLGPSPSPLLAAARFKQIELSWGAHQLKNPKPWLFSLDDGRLTLTDVSLSGGQTHLDLSGDYDDDRLTLVGEGTIDLDLAKAVVPDLLQAEGLAKVALLTTRAGGHRSTSVNASISASLLEHRSFPGLFEETQAELSATENLITLLELRSSLGGGNVEGHGTIHLKNGDLSRMELKTTASDVQLRWVPWLPAVIGDATLTLDGPADALLLKGDVQINEMRFHERMDWEDWVVQFEREMLIPKIGPASAPLFSLDVKVSADQSVHFENNLVEGIASAQLHFIGDNEKTGLIGQALLHEGHAFFQDRDFTIERGEFNWRDPWSWDPDVDFDLLTTLQSMDQRYRIRYRLFGPFSTWESSTQSEPALSQADINTLLWFGLTASALEGQGELVSAVGQGVADMVIADFLANNTLGAAQDWLNFVNLEIATGVTPRGNYSPDPRLVLQRRFESIANTSVRWEMNMLHSQQWHLQGKNQINDRLSLSAWYASQQRQGDRFTGALGVDLRLRTEWD